MLETYLDIAREVGASDIHFTYGLPPIVRLNGTLKHLKESPLTNEVIMKMATSVLTQLEIEKFMDGSDIDTAFSSKGLRYRLNVYRQKDKVAMAIRLLQNTIPTFEQLQLPDIFAKLCDSPRGLILVTGPTGSGKSTTLAAMINYINTNKRLHILTMEDPIEYVHEHKACMINQREIGKDSDSYLAALKSALREDPDVILVGELRDYETISLAISAAETGHLVFATLHTSGSAQTVDRMVDVFPAHQQAQIRTQLATSLKAVISQHLLPKSNGSGRIACFETMIVNDAIANLIRENKTYQIPTVMQTSARDGMMILDNELMRLVNSGIIDLETALLKCTDKKIFQKLF